MKNIVLAIAFIVGMAITAYYLGWIFAYVGVAIESLFTSYPENKYR